MAKRRFLSRCISYNMGVGAGKIIVIDNQRGYETDNEAEIAAIKGHKDFGNFVYEVLTQEALKAANKRAAKNLLKAVCTMVEAKGAKNLTPMQQRKVALNIGRASTGTGFITFFAAAALKGLLQKLDDTEDKNLAAMYRAAGLTGAQLNISALKRSIDGGSTDRMNGDIMASVEFLEPLDSMMNIGIMLARAEEKNLGSLMDATLEGAFNAFVDTPMMQTFAAAYNAIQYHDEESDMPLLAEVGIEIARSSLSGFIPGPVRQLAQARDPITRDTRADTKSDQLMRSLQNSLPGLREQLPAKLDGLGQEISRGDNTALNYFNAFLAPDRISEYQETPVQREIYDLYNATGAGSVIPRRNAPGGFKYGGEQYELNMDERRGYQGAQGRHLNDVLSGLIQSDEYRNANATDKVKLFEDARALAADTGKAQYLAGQNVQFEQGGWKAKTRELANIGIDTGAAIFYHNALSNIEKNAEAAGVRGGDINRAKREYLYSLQNLNGQQKEAIDAAFIDDTIHLPKEVNPAYSGDYDSFIISQLSEAGQRNFAHAQAAGMNAQTYAWLYPIAAQNGVSKDEAVYNLMAAGLSYEQAMYFYKIANKAKPKN